MTHWADVTAAELLARRAGRQVFATAITPSGPIHVGNMREVLTTEAVFRAARDAGADAELLYIADDCDPLRKVSPFLVQNEADIDYEQYVGRPLREVPCPCGEHPDYARHFLEPFLSNLGHLGIGPTLLSAYDMYREGRYADAIATAMAKAPQVRAIVEEVSKRQLPKEWVPFNVQCAACGRVKDVQVTGVEGTRISYRCGCGNTGDADATTPGVGKLPWRLDWPARWQFLGVTFEAFGKDHGAAGGSWDSGIRLVREVFGGLEPHHLMYEFLHLKGQGAMHSSTGLAVSAEELLRMTPPEVLRYLLMRQSPRKHIDFDPGLGLIQLVEEYDRFERVYFGADNPGTFTEVERTYGLSCPRAVPPALPVKAPFKHLVTVVQMADDVADIAAILERSGEMGHGADLAALSQRVEHVRYWLRRFAPDSVRFAVLPSPPRGGLDAVEKELLAAVATALAATAWNGQAIHDAIYAVKGELSPGEAFRPIYHAILGQDRGPRAGFFLSSLQKEWVVARLQAAAQ